MQHRPAACENPPPFSVQRVISFARYTEVLRSRDLRRTFAVSVLGRLPIGITGLAILLLVQAASGSFALGGSASGCYVAGLAIVAPLIGRLIDRYGPRWPLVAGGTLFPAALCTLVWCVERAQPHALVLASAAAAGATFPPITVCMRTYLKRLFAQDSALATAYSLESVLIEMIFIIGPALVALVVAVASPAIGVLLAAACALFGTALFLRSPALATWRIEPRVSGSLLGPLADPAFVPLMALVLCYSAAFGLTEIGVAAYAASAGSPALAGVLLAVMSIGSAAGGLTYGSRHWHAPLARQFSITLALMGTGLLALVLPWWKALFVVACLAAGIVMAPALIIQSMLVAKTARPEHATEAFTWSNSALLAGVGAGIAAGGALLDVFDWRAPFAAGAATALLAALGAALWRRR